MKRRGFLGALAAIASLPLAAKAVEVERASKLPLLDLNVDEPKMARCARCGAKDVRRVMVTERASNGVAFASEGYLPAPSSGLRITEGCEMCAGLLTVMLDARPVALREDDYIVYANGCPKVRA